MICPKCGSSKLQKKGTRAGKQRYRCTSCGANFTEGVLYKSAPPLLKDPNLKCLYCGSNHVIRDGKLPDGKQRYKCVDCGKDFSEKTRPIQYCPYCGGKLTYSGYGKLGQIRYQCSSCNKNCSGDLITGKPIKRYFFQEANIEVKCPKCGSKNIKKDGFRKERQKFYCNTCGNHFLEEKINYLHSEEDRLKVLKMVFKGKNVNKIAEELKYTVGRVRAIARPYYKKEKLSDKQKEMIIKYGYYLKVPIDYLAEYVPCSQRACKELLEKFKSTTPDAKLKSPSRIYHNSSAQNQ